MMALVILPDMFGRFTRQVTQLVVPGDSVRAVLLRLAEDYPALAPYVLTKSRQVPTFVSLYLNGEDIRHVGGLGAEVSEQDELQLVPAISGG